MVLIIISVILTIVTVGFIFLGCLGGNYNKKWCLLGLVWLLLIGLGCFTTIQANHVGIMFNAFKGGVQDEVLGEGFRGKTPFDKVYKISTEMKELKFENMSVQTNDSQFVNAIIQLQVRINKDEAFKYFKKYGGKNLEDIQGTISNTVQKELEQVTTQYNIMELLGEKRNEIVDKTLIASKNELKKDGILVERVILVDTDAGDEIEKAISKEAQKKKEVDTAKYEKEKAELEGEAKVIKAKKEKEANELKQKSLTQEILIEKMLSKWNGQLPTTMMSDDVMSVFSINKK